MTQAAETFNAPVPVVMITSSEHTHTLASVSVDNRAGGRMATRHLIDSGHREVVHLAGPQDWYDAQDRLVGWRQECEAAGLPAPEPIQGDWTAGRGYDIGRRLLREGLPSAIFAANDQLALGLLRAFWEGGIRVPDDVSVVGFDDSAGTAYYIPPLTTVRQEFGRLGTATVHSLQAAIAGERPDRIVIPTTLVVRASSTPHR